MDINSNICIVFFHCSWLFGSYIPKVYSLICQDWVTYLSICQHKSFFQNHTGQSKMNIASRFHVGMILTWHGMAWQSWWQGWKRKTYMKASSLQWMGNCQSIWAPRGILDCHQYSMPLIPNVSDGINTQCHWHPCHICISIIVSVIITLSSVKVDVDEKAKKFDDDCKVHRPSSKVCFQSSSSKFQGLEMSSKFTRLPFEVRTSIQSNLTFVR